MKQFTPVSIASTLAATGVLALSPLAIAPAQAVVLTFDSLTQANGNISNTAANVVSPDPLTYTENGFKLTTTGQGFASYGTLSTNYAGSTALFNRTPTGTTTLSQVGGGLFSLISIDLTHQRNLVSPDPSPLSTSIAFTGRKGDNSIVTQSFTIDNNFSTFPTFTFSNTFVDLVSVSWNQGSTAQTFHQFDNIAATAAPEPFTILGTLLGIGSTVALKRKLAATRSDDNDLN